MTIEVWLAFAVASAVLLVIPGPTILAVISYSIAHGARASLSLVAAVCLGDSTALAFSLLGLGVLLSTSAFWFSVVKILGGVYLIYLAIKLFRAGVSPIDDQEMRAGSNNLFINTYIITALNPKGIVFFIAFLPQFVDTTVDTSVQLWILSTTFVVLAAINTFMYCFFASSARGFFQSAQAQQRFNLAGGSLLGIAGVWALRNS